MWLATKNGFYSVVKDRNVKGIYRIRARVKKDLLNLFPKKRVVVDFDADYHYRVLVTKEELNNFMLANSEIDYDNFKDSIKKTSQKDKIPYYLEIWSLMYKYQWNKGWGNFKRFRNYIADELYGR